MSCNSRAYKQFQYSEKRRRHLNIKAGFSGCRFPVGQVQHHLRQRTKSRFFITDDAAVFTVAVVEFLCAEILEQAGLLSRVIRPQHLQAVFAQDVELRQTVGMVLVPKTGDGLCEVFGRLSVV